MVNLFGYASLQYPFKVYTFSGNRMSVGNCMDSVLMVKGCMGIYIVSKNW